MYCVNEAHTHTHTQGRQFTDLPYNIMSKVGSANLGRQAKHDYYYMELDDGAMTGEWTPI